MTLGQVGELPGVGGDPRTLVVGDEVHQVEAIPGPHRPQGIQGEHDPIDQAVCDLLALEQAGDRVPGTDPDERGHALLARLDPLILPDASANPGECRSIRPHFHASHDERSKGSLPTALAKALN